MLCNTCQDVNIIDAFFHEDEVKHHTNYANLVQSADLGCEFCKTAQQGVLIAYSDELRLSIADAEELHLEQDQYDRLDENHSHSFYLVPCGVELDEQYSILQKGLIGATYERRAEGEDEIPLSSVYTLLEIFVHHERQPTVVERHSEDLLVEGSSNDASRVIGQQLKEDPDFDLALTWIQECRSKHSKCTPAVTSFFPRRIVDVGLHDRDKVKLLEGKGINAEYLTLSHCWGGGQTFCTTSGNYQNNLTQIPWAVLPKTFQDAVLTTRRLGFRFLWIDSICIIQDRKEDWDAEWPLMGEIYESAVLTIACANARDSHTGFLARKDPPGTTFRLGSLSNQESLYICYNGNNSIQMEPELDTPLSKRSWALQERLLSHRILYFGNKQMYWECVTNSRYECLRDPFVFNYQRQGFVQKVIYQSLRTQNDRIFWLKYWYQLVSTYADTKLTYSSDKLPAISGLAKKIEALLGFRYIAGLWAEDLASGMSWSYSSARWSTQRAPTPMDYRAPSWSWAALDLSISYFTVVSIVQDFHILDVDLRYRDQDTHGRILSGILRIEARVKSGTVRKLVHHVRPAQTGLYLCQGCLSVSRIGEFLPDDSSIIEKMQRFDSGWRDPNTEAVGQCKVLLLFLGTCRVMKRWFALAIEKVPNESDTYKRIGVVSNDLEPEESQDWFNSGQRKYLQLI